MKKQQFVDKCRSDFQKMKIARFVALFRMYSEIIKEESGDLHEKLKYYHDNIGESEVCLKFLTEFPCSYKFRSPPSLKDDLVKDPKMNAKITIRHTYSGTVKEFETNHFFMTRKWIYYKKFSKNKEINISLDGPYHIDVEIFKKILHFWHTGEFTIKNPVDCIKVHYSTGYLLFNMSTRFGSHCRKLLRCCTKVLGDHVKTDIRPDKYVEILEIASMIMDNEIITTLYRNLKNIYTKLYKENCKKDKQEIKRLLKTIKQNTEPYRPKKFLFAE